MVGFRTCCAVQGARFARACRVAPRQRLCNNEGMRQNQDSLHPTLPIQKFNPIHTFSFQTDSPTHRGWRARLLLGAVAVRTGSSSPTQSSLVPCHTCQSIGQTDAQQTYQRFAHSRQSVLQHCAASPRLVQPALVSNKLFRSPKLCMPRFVL